MGLKYFTNIYGCWLVITTVCFVTGILSKSCLQVKLEHEQDCQDVDNYVDCVRTRMKRQSSNCRYEDQCFECDCDFCQYSLCGGQCSDCCNSCCENYVQCRTNHCCHKQCHSECRSYNCRSSCRKSCYESVSREKTDKEVDRDDIERVLNRTIKENGGTTITLKSSRSNGNAHNITTVINLKNVINNTNLIDVPINLNYTNRNNISLSEAANVQCCPRSSNFSKDNCCIVIGPRQCYDIQIYPYKKCFHLRSKQCGSVCTSTVMHKEYPMCTTTSFGQIVCQGQAAYIPQPQPRCTYSNIWPYVTCGIQPPVSCEGCYGHYFNFQLNEYKSCPPQCYNDFGAGPLYRQGPFYQPTYSHLPPCYLSPQGCSGLGGLGIMGAYGGGRGGYGGGLGQGFGGNFDYAAQLPMLPPMPPFSQPEHVPINSTIPTTNNKTFLNSSGIDQRQLHRRTRHIDHSLKSGSIHDSRMDHTYTTSVNSHRVHRELLNEITIDQYPTDRDDRLELPYELPDQEVEIDVRIIDSKETRDFQLPFIRNTLKEQNGFKEENSDRV